MLTVGRRIGVMAGRVKGSDARTWRDTEAAPVESHAGMAMGKHRGAVKRGRCGDSVRSRVITIGTHEQIGTGTGTKTEADAEATAETGGGRMRGDTSRNRKESEPKNES